MQISHRRFGSASVLDVRGPLVGLLEAERLARALTDVPPASPVVVVNLAAARELDDYGLLALGTASRTLRQQRRHLRMAGVPASARRRLRSATGGSDVYETVEDALVDIRDHLARRSSWLAAIRRIVTRWLGPSSARPSDEARAHPRQFG